MCGIRKFSVDDGGDHLHVMHGDLNCNSHTSLWVSDDKSFDRLKEYVTGKLKDKIRETFIEYDKIITKSISNLQDIRECKIDDIKNIIKTIEEL